MIITAVAENRNKEKKDKLASTESGNQDHWAKSLEAVSADATGILKAFGEPRYVVLKRIKEANLIGPRSVSCSLEEYLDNPSKYLITVKTPSVHVFVEPKEGIVKPRMRFKDMPIKKQLEYADELSELLDKDSFVVTVVESPKLLYHGNVIVYADQDLPAHLRCICPKVNGEFVLGDSLPVSRPGVNPDFRFWQDPYTEGFKYENCAPSLRQLFWQVLKMMPKELAALSASSSNRPTFKAGYYEIGIAKDADRNTPRIYFYDAKPWGKR